MKIAFFITSNLYVRNYISNGLFDELKLQYNVDCFITNDVDVKINLKQYKKFSVRKNFRRFSSILNDIRTIKFKNITNSFLYRYKRQKLASKQNFKDSIIIKLKEIIAANNIFYNFFELIIKNYPVRNEHNKLIRKYDLIIIPNSGTDADLDYLLKISNESKVLSYMLVDNWDNLSSKSIMLFKPSYLATMSRQCLIHGEEIQNINSKNIFVIGNSRFEIYKEEHKKNLFKFEYLLFAGCNLPYNEINVLKKISKDLINTDLKIIYRPHPWRQKRINENFDEINELKNVILDPQISSNFNRIGDIKFQPDLNYYNDLIKNSIYVISPLSTFLIEALICKKPTIVLIEDEKENFTSPYKVYKNYKHFNEISNIKNTYLLKDLKKFMFFHKKLFKKNNYKIDSNKKGIDFHILFNDTSFINHLTKSINEIIERNYK